MARFRSFRPDLEGALRYLFGYRTADDPGRFGKALSPAGTLGKQADADLRSYRGQAETSAGTGAGRSRRLPPGPRSGKRGHPSLVPQPDNGGSGGTVAQNGAVIPGP